MNNYEYIPPVVIPDEEREKKRTIHKVFDEDFNPTEGYAYSAVMPIAAYDPKSNEIVFICGCAEHAEILTGYRQPYIHRATKIGNIFRGLIWKKISKKRYLELCQSSSLNLTKERYEELKHRIQDYGQKVKHRPSPLG